jgi:hypothetical protein
MYYYYVYTSQRIPYTYSDYHVGTSDPYKVFDNRRWFHINDTTGKIDMNINMANKTRRKLNRKLR